MLNIKGILSLDNDLTDKKYSILNIRTQEITQLTYQTADRMFLPPLMFEVNIQYSEMQPHFQCFSLFLQLLFEVLFLRNVEYPLELLNQMKKA